MSKSLLSSFLSVLFFFMITLQTQLSLSHPSRIWIVATFLQALYEEKRDIFEKRVIRSLLRLWFVEPGKKAGFLWDIHVHSRIWH